MYKLCDDAAKSRSVRYSAAYPTGAERSAICGTMGPDPIVTHASIGSIQVEVYSDRVEVISPGRIHRAITVAELYKKHESFATNPRIARAMYQVKYIETIGTGLTDLLKECKAKGLREPLLEEVSGRFRIVIWRPAPATNRGDNGGAIGGTIPLWVFPMNSVAFVRY